MGKDQFMLDGLTRKREVVMQKTLKFGAAILMTAGIVAGISGAVRAADNCHLYAISAAKQALENKKNSCGMKGDEWSIDVKAHIAWCRSVSPEVWRELATKRQKALESCGK